MADGISLRELISVIAHFTFGVTGALAGVQRGYDFIGIIFLAIATALGGGLIRDGLLISQGPAAMATQADIFYIVLVSAIFTLIFHRHIPRISHAIAILDGLGLGAFAVLGVDRSVEAGLSLPGVILGGTLTAVGGGLLRDILVREEPLLFKPGQFYALVAIGGCGLYLALTRTGLCSQQPAASATILVVFVFRMLAIHFNWQTAAHYRVPPPA